MKHLINFLGFLICGLASSAQVNIYDASTLPSSLLKGAYSVKRSESIVFDIKSAGSGSYKVHQVITVLDANGKDELVFQQFSNKFRSLENAEIKVYDAKGNQLNKYKKREMKTFAASEEDVDDIKITMFAVSAASYPITLDIDYEISYNSFFQYENYRIQDPGQAVENSNFTVNVPAELDIRYKAMNTSIKPVIKADAKSGTKSYSWNCSNMSARKTEEGAGRTKNYFPWIMIAPNRIDYDGYKGEISSWKNMGLWYNNLVKEIKEVPANLKTEMQALVSGAANDLEKARIIYDYLQKNFRYVSIQLGIGGLKPFPASYVHAKKYGDCKALSNYMQTCLEAVGVKSYNAWITSDPYPPAIDPAFAYDHFNHQVLCMLNGKDTVWVECTSKTLGLGELSSNTENRYALLLTENGGVLVKTPDSRSAKNIFNTNTQVDLDAEASGKVSTTITGKGEYRQELYYVSRSTPDKQKDYFVRYLDFPNPDEHRASFSTSKNEAMTANLEMLVEKIPDFTAGSKMFLNPRSYSIWQYKMPDDVNRTQDFYFDCPFDKSDTTVYKLPEDFVVEALPKFRDLKFEYGNFKTSYTYDAEKKTVTTTAHLVLNDQKIPAAKYATARKFFSDVLEEFTDKIVVRKK